MIYKDSKNAKIIQILQLEGGALVSKVKWPGFTISRYVVKLQMAREKGKHASKLKILIFLKSAYQRYRKNAWSSQDFSI
jgi:hypothetical protein